MKVQITLDFPGTSWGLCYADATGLVLRAVSTTGARRAELLGHAARRLNDGFMHQDVTEEGLELIVALRRQVQNLQNSPA